MATFPVVGIVGPRQVGKTTLSKTLMELIPNETIYIDLESPSDYERLTSNVEWFLNSNTDKTIIIDEVQQYLPLFPVLRSVIDKNRWNGRFILLGSASPAFLAKSSETLAGRIAFVELNPINVLEYNNQEELWFRGGFPNALLAADEEEWYAWQENFIQSYVERDLAQLGMNASAKQITQLLFMLASVTGNTVSFQSLSNSLKMDQRTMKKYLEILEQAYLVRTLAPWYVNIGKRLTKSPKLYIRDSGNLHYLSNVSSFSQLTQNAIVGHSWEGFVIEQIVGNLKSSFQPYFYRTLNGAEVDLVIVKGVEPIVSFEIKLSIKSGISRGNTSSILELKTKHNFLLTPEGGDFMLNENWRVLNLKEALGTLDEMGMLF